MNRVRESHAGKKESCVRIACENKSIKSCI